jgi:hypothetical protein
MVCRNGGYDIQKLLENALIFMNEIDIRDLLQNHLGRGKWKGAD